MKKHSGLFLLKSVVKILNLDTLELSKCRHSLGSPDDRLTCNEYFFSCKFAKLATLFFKIAN